MVVKAFALWFSGQTGFESRSDQPQLAEAQLPQVARTIREHRATEIRPNRPTQSEITTCIISLCLVTSADSRPLGQLGRP
jgi:hypothetical protein